MLLYSHHMRATVHHDDAGIRLASGVHFKLEDGEEFWTPVLPREAPFVFYNLMRRSERGGQRWGGVIRGDLRTGATEAVLDGKDVPPMAWVKNLFAASDDARTLTVLAGHPFYVQDGTQMAYGVHELDVSTKAFTKLLDLANAFG